MASKQTRRSFLGKLGVAAAALPFISYVNSAQAAVPGLKLGYSAITWGGNDRQAVKEISSLGFKGIQLRSNALKEFGDKPEELHKLLAQHRLELAMFSSGNANINTGDDEAVIQQHVDHARFVKALGGQYIQVTNSSRPKEGTPSTADLQQYGRLLNEIGKRTSEIGILTAYHNHMHQLGETPEEVDVIIENSNEQYVKLLLDVAHYHQGGGDPAQAIQKYKGRLKALHLKDVRPVPEEGPKAYKFVELGQGEVDLPAVFDALQQINFQGWGIVELDSVPDKGKTPLQCAQVSRNYLKGKGMRV
ncbi:sugar phosphate isomerase/epimerase family protein [Pontibacter silvestris]|uniref:Sugar phosphate isomerase/epimerase family protein n=1 Tax=Pontibacter silvestris TaxID=2305183 RepID=A0ABW4X4S1_9BACT|nr:sugar phosphate isomerase/epimerase [Pontibacter silvestris]MCC9134850.1 sugar phosphate isomerase/epimerase [Pontibacter silvestris]